MALGPAVVREQVELLLTSPETQARIAAVWLLGRATALPSDGSIGTVARGPQEKDARQALVIALGDPAAPVRAGAVCALGRHGDARGIVPLERHRDRMSSLGEPIAWALEEIRFRIGPPLVLRGGTVVDGTGAPPRTGTTVVVEGGTITRVAADTMFNAPDGATVVDVSGRWITPGLWDMHVHLGKAGAESLSRFLAAGITSVRDMGGDPGTIFGWRREIAEGTRVGPRIVTAGPMLEAPATLARMAEKSTNEPWHQTRVPVTGVDAAAAVVDSVIALGVDFLKVRETADLDTYRAIAAAARARGVALAGHAPFGMDVAEGTRLGLATFEHASYPYPLDTVPAERRRILRAFREGGTAVVPTMVAWSTRLMAPDSLTAFIADSAGHRDPRRKGLAEGLVQEWRFDVAAMTRNTPSGLRGWCGFVNRTLADLAALHQAGVPILVGTDVGLPGLLPGWSLHDELRVLVEGGVLSAADAVRSATALAARHAGRGDILGTVEPGRYADLIVLEDDPTVDIAALRQPTAVIHGGVILEEAKLAPWRGSTTSSRNSPIELFPGVEEAGCAVLRPTPIDPT